MVLQFRAMFLTSMGRDFCGSTSPMTIGEFEPQTSYMQSCYLTHCAVRPSEFGNYVVCKKLCSSNSPVVNGICDP